MFIKETATGIRCEVIIESVLEEDYKKLTVKRFFFLWKLEKRHRVLKLRISGRSEVLGLMSLEDIYDEKRIEIRLLTVSVENVGKKRQYEGIAGCLIAYACRRSVSLFAEYACVSLKPKTVLRKHYQETYNMLEAGERLCLLGDSLLNLLKNRDYE